MPETQVKGCNIANAMKPEQKGQDSLHAFFRQAVGKEPFLTFSQAGESPIQWIQLLHALDHPGADKHSQGLSGAEGSEHIPLEYCSSGTSFTSEMSGIKESASVIKDVKSGSDQIPCTRIPEAVIAFAQAAAKTNSEPEKYLSGWPLLCPPKIQLQKCEKCSREFCSLVNYRRHIRVHRRPLNIDKDFRKNRNFLGAFWDKLSVDEAMELVSFKNVTLEDVSGPSILRALSSFIRKPGFSLLPQAYLKAGAALLDVIQAGHPSLPVASEELFNILDDASERTFLCAGMAPSMQKFIFDGEVGKIALDMKNLIACTSFLIEQKLVKAWVADKDAEALRCQKLLVEEEEAAQKRQAELLERKRLKKLRQKEHKAREHIVRFQMTEHSKEDASNSLVGTASVKPQPASCELPPQDVSPQSCELPIQDNSSRSDSSSAVAPSQSSCSSVSDILTQSSFPLSSDMQSQSSMPFGPSNMYTSSPMAARFRSQGLRGSHASQTNDPPEDSSSHLHACADLVNGETGHTPSCDTCSLYALQQNDPPVDSPSHLHALADSIEFNGKTGLSQKFSGIDCGAESRKVGLSDIRALPGHGWQQLRNAWKPVRNGLSDGLYSSYVPFYKLSVARKKSSSANGHKVWTPKIKYGTEVTNAEYNLQREHTGKFADSSCHAVLIGSISVALGDRRAAEPSGWQVNKQTSSAQMTRSSGLNCTVGLSESGQNALFEVGASPDKNTEKECTVKQDTKNDSEIRTSEVSFMGVQFSSCVAEAFLAQRWKEAIAADHVMLVLPSESECSNGAGCAVTDVDLLSGTCSIPG